MDHYTVVDEQTITITVKEANADTLSNLGSFVILPKHIWENVDDPNAYTGEGCLSRAEAAAIVSRMVRAELRLSLWTPYNSSAFAV